MKKTGKGLLVLAATVMSFVSVQNVCAETVEGNIVAISVKPNIVTVEDIVTSTPTDVYGVKFNYLESQYNIELNAGDYVSFEASTFPCKDGDEVLKASSITVGDVTVTW